MATTFAELKADYAALWRQMQLRPERLPEIDAIARRLIAAKNRYQAVATATRVPWAVIAVLHQREASGSFAGVLHNGQKIIGTGQLTTIVPKGRGPFSSWEQSAVDALTTAPHELQRVGDWSIERVCYEVERYNGFGYRKNHPGVRSPYLWSFCTNYASGKYVADGRFDPSAVDAQCGTMPILKRIMELDPAVRFDGDGSGSFAPQDPIAFGMGAVGAGSLGIGSVGEGVRRLQVALTGQGFPVGVIDGEFGPDTQAGVIAFQRARHLPMTGIADPATLQALAASAAPPPAQAPQPSDVLVALLAALRGGAQPAPPVPSSQSGDVLRVILEALAGRAVATPPADAAGDRAPDKPILSPIDRMLGGEALAGKKTALSIVAYVILAILKTLGIVSAASPAGQIVGILITAFGALGGVSKVDRVIQALGAIAAKR